MIKISNINKYYNKNKSNVLHVLNDISLELPDTGMVAIFGRSGCGKTTLLNVIGGLDKFSDGTIMIDNENIRSNTDVLRNREIGYIFQNYNLSNKENCYDNVASALKLCGMTDEEEINKRVTAALENVDMAKYRLRLPNTLSGGQMQRIAIARAIVKNPKIILADEPTGNLDEHNTIMIMDLLREISKNHLVILVTHEANLVNLYCDKVIALSDGKILNVRDNIIEGSYVAKDKNRIYLGELNKQEESNGIVNLEYYGKEPTEPIDIKIVNYNGKMYLQLNNPKIQILDETSEVKLQEGVFQTEGVKKEKELRMREIPSFEGKNYGHLFNLKDSIKTGFIENFKIHKVGNKILKLVLFLFALILVIMTARFGVSIRNIFENEEKYNHNAFYVYTPTSEYSMKLKQAQEDGNAGIASIGLVNRNDVDGASLSFNIGKFESYQENNLFSTGISVGLVKLPSSLAQGKRVVVGKGTVESGEVIVSTKVADKIIEQSTVGYVSKYRDVIGFTCNLRQSYYYYDGGSNATYRIVGVVESNELEAYFCDLDLALDFIDTNRTFYIYPASAVGFEVGANGATYIKYYPDDVVIGDTCKVNGKNYTITRIINYGEETEELKVYFYNNTLIINDEDFINCSKYYGEYSDFLKIGYGSDSVYDTPYTLVYSNDVEKTEAFLREEFKDIVIPGVFSERYKVIFTPEMMKESVYKDTNGEIKANIITLCIFIALLSICMYFIMHSMMMVRIKEIGVYRAIGVTKKNLIFKFWIETLILTTLTVFIGYLVASGMLAVWFAKASIMKNTFYYPVWMAIAVLVFLYGISSVCGLIPIVMLLRKTPSEILSKYDI